MHFDFFYDIISKLSRRRPVGQAVKTLASHAGNMGSIPVRVTKKEHRTKVLCSFFDDLCRKRHTARESNKEIQQTLRVRLGSQHCSAASVSEALQGGANSCTTAQLIIKNKIPQEYQDKGASVFRRRRRLCQCLSMCRREMPFLFRRNSEWACGR